MKFKDAVREATLTVMEDDRVFLMGVGITDTSANVYGTLTGVLEQFGPKRVIEGPLSENALTGIALGASLLGQRPILIHHRMDFTLLAMDQLVNHAAKWKAMFGTTQKLPLVIRAIVGRGWGNGVQHTQSLHATYAHIPGLKVVVPATPNDAYGMLLSAVQDTDPVVYIEHRWLHEDEAPVDPFAVPLGRAIVRRSGKDVTLVAIGPMVTEAMRAATAMAGQVDSEVIDPRTLAPLDTDRLLASIAKTGRLVVADADWSHCGLGAEIIARAAEHGLLTAPPRRVTWPTGYVGSGRQYEEAFYPGAAEIQLAIEAVCGLEPSAPTPNTIKPFAGPF